jgi:GNAT superfamily N-acetyltransferase
MIRRAELSDVEHLVLLAAEMHEESRYSILTFDAKKMANFFIWAIQTDDNLVLVAETNGEIIGAFIGYVVEHVCSHDKIAGDYALYISPSHRGSTAGMRLLKSFTEWARIKDAVIIQPGVTTGVHTEATAKLYEAAGYRRVGVVLEYVGKS